MTTWSTGLLLAVLSIACVNTDAAVFVDPSVANPAATVTAVTLGTDVTGSFDLKLHLGPRATGPSKVSLDMGIFTILDAQQNGALVSPLPVVTTTTFPVNVDLDSDVTATFTFDTGAKQLPAAMLCDPAGVVIGGAIQDSLQDRATPFASAAFHPAGCM
jgi:hypothetical protein